MEWLLRTTRGRTFEPTLTDPDIDLNVPALCDVEAVAALRRLSRSGVLTARRRDEAVADYVDLPLTRHGHVPLLPRILDLDANFSAYDATYVALAELLHAELLTADDRIARAVRTHTAVTLV